MIITYFGNPGCGKSTLAVKEALKSKKYYKFCYLNFDTTIDGVLKSSLDGLGSWTFPDNTLVLIDEAGIEYNNRSYKSFPKSAIRWYKKHRHYKCDVHLFSQSWEDTDITLRRLSSELWYLKNIGPFTLQRRIWKSCDVDPISKQIIDGYSKASALWLLVWFLQLDGGWFAPRWKLTFRPFYYQYFDSYSKDDIPIGDFELQTTDTKYNFLTKLKALSLWLISPFLRWFRKFYFRIKRKMHKSS